MLNYKFREDELIAEFKNYIDSTYKGHYGQGGLQSSEIIVDRGHGQGFFHGNIDKYNGRYGKKGTRDDQRKDIVKIIHYGFLALYEHDRIHEVPAQTEYSNLPGLPSEKVGQGAKRVIYKGKDKDEQITNGKIIKVAGDIVTIKWSDGKVSNYNGADGYIDCSYDSEYPWTVHEDDCR